MKYTVTETPVLGSFFRALAKIILRAAGYKKIGRLPDHLKQFVCIMAPHTSNWDAVLILLFVLAFGTKTKLAWLGKKSNFRWPLRGFLRWFGGIPIERTGDEGLVEQGVMLFRENEYLYLGILPEGTRRKLDHWKTGFYHIARRAGVPIVCIYGDSEKKIAGFGPVLDPSMDDLDAVFEKLRAFYGGRKGIIPGNESDIRHRDGYGFSTRTENPYAVISLLLFPVPLDNVFRW